MYYPPLTVIISSTVVTVAVLHITFGASASNICHAYYGYFSFFVVFGGVCVFLRIHAYVFSHPAGGFYVPTYLAVLSLGILWRFWGIM